MTGIAIILLEVFTFTVVAAGVFVAASVLDRQLRVQRRLGDAVRSPATSPVVRQERVTNPFLKWIQSAFLSDSKDMTKLRASLIEAGYEHPAAPMWYVVIRYVLAVGLPLGFIAANAVLRPGGGGPLTLILPLVLSGVGLLAPSRFVRYRASALKTKIEHQFPDALDLMLICVESGLGLEAAFQRVGREVTTSHPEIAREFGSLSEELAAGRGRAEALRSMAGRLNVDTVKAFVALVIQTEALGVSVAQSLRTYSTEMRETRFLKAEEKAMRIPVLMTVPLVACFMPVIIVALLLPPAIDTIRTLLPIMKGQ